MTRALCIAWLALAAVGAIAAPPVDRVGFAPADEAVLPADVRFVDEDGRRVRLGALLAPRATIVVPAYYGCTNLCTTVLQGVAAAIGASGLRAGFDLDVVVVSIDALDSPAAARAMARAVLPEGQAGWHFLSGGQDAIDRFTAALGYRYARDVPQAQFAHAAGIAVTSPGGRIARVLYGAAFPAPALRDALAATRAPMRADRIPDAARTWLLCFHYDPRTGRYTFAAMTAVRAASLAALLALAAFAGFSRTRERGRR